MSTDIYLSKEVHEQYVFNAWHDCEAGIGEVELIHDPCQTTILEINNLSAQTHWDAMESMSKHNRECPAGKSKRLAPSPGLYVPESEIRRG